MKAWCCTEEKKREYINSIGFFHLLIYLFVYLFEKKTIAATTTTKMRRADLEATMSDSRRGLSTNRKKRKRTQGVVSNDSHKPQSNPRFLLRSSRGSQLRNARRVRFTDSKGPTVAKVTATSGTTENDQTSGSTKRLSAAQRLRQEFKNTTPDFVLHRKAVDPIQNDMLRISRALGVRARTHKTAENHPLPPAANTADATPAHNDGDGTDDAYDAIERMLTRDNNEAGAMMEDLFRNEKDTQSSSSSSSSSSSDDDGDGDDDDDPIRHLQDMERYRPLVGYQAPSQPPFAPSAEGAGTEQMPSRPRKSPNERDRGSRAKPWLQTCRDLDELRNRVPGPDPAVFSTVLDRIATTGTPDPRGPDVPVGHATHEASPPPPMDKVVCSVQNWVVRLDCVLDRYSVSRAFAQARRDLLVRRSLYRPPEEPRDYNRWYVEKLREDYATSECNNNSNNNKFLQGWEELLLRLQNEERCGEPPNRRIGVPIWDRANPRAQDLVRRLNTALGAPLQQNRSDWCDNAGLNYPPTLNLHDLAFRMRPQGTRYDIHHFSALKLSTVNPKAGCLVYASSRAQAGTKSSARVLCTGAKTPEEVAWTLRRLMSSMRGAGGPPLRVDRDHFTVTNVVASVLLPYYVNMDSLVRQCQLYCTYTPAVFTGATLRLPQLGKMTILVFTTKLNITGAKNKSMLLKALHLAVQITWRARHINVENEIAQSMPRAPQRVLMELLEDADRLPQHPNMSPWGIAIRYDHLASL